jgi:hypothetical protein
VQTGIPRGERADVEIVQCSQYARPHDGLEARFLDPRSRAAPNVARAAALSRSGMAEDIGDGDKDVSEVSEDLAEVCRARVC